MSRKYKKLAAILLAIIMMFSFATSAFAAQNPVGIESNKGETVLLDVFIADHYKMAAYTDDDTAWS